ncbi:MAG TPA: ATP-binding protein [Candidatus Sulfotelmatobacter sp.]|nr:ATP-binding protein [Candidatus Sulfotelmatobacter sp.]
MRAKLFWKLGLTYLALLFGVLLAVDIYSAGVLEREYIRSSADQLASLLKLAKTRLPQLDNQPELHAWAQWIAQAGVRVTVIDQTGRVMADSANDTESLANLSDRPEVQQAFATGEGEATRHSQIGGADLLYRAMRYQPPGGQPVVIRLAAQLAPLDAARAELRRRLLAASLVILGLGLVVSLAFSRMLAVRVERLKDFSRRVADGDFRSLPADRPRDELSELRETLNETAQQLELEIGLLSSERNRSSAILRSMVEGVAVVDAQGRLVFYNRAFSEILNLDGAGGGGRPLIEVVRNSELLGLIRKALKGEEGLQTDIVTGIVQQRSFSVTAAPVKALETGPMAGAATQFGAAEKPSGAVVVLHDVTELRRLERVRQDFVANVSHEFKTPLTAIQGFAETLLAGALDDPNNNRRFLEIIRDHATRLARLTDDLLKLARIEAGKLELEFSAVGITELIEGCAETTLLKASRKQIVVEIENPPDLPAVWGDASLLHEVLQNLLDNAIQYTAEGGHIRVSATAAAREAVISVADTGIGIPLADQERIFERFYRVDAARSREAGGTGLGLSIAKHIVEAHGGRLWVESAVGRGSTFSFSMPLAT